MQASGDILEHMETSGGIRKASGGHLGGIWGIWEASGRHLGGIWGIWVTSGRHLVASGAGWLGWLTEIPVLISKTSFYIGFSWFSLNKPKNIMFSNFLGTLKMQICAV